MNDLLKKMKKSRGFTIIESMGAVFLISVALIGSITLISQTISFMSVYSQRLVASYLAQEGIEIVRNIRDANWLEGVVWDAGLASSGDYEADYTYSDLDSFVLNKKLNIDSSGFYSYNAGGRTSVFIRKIMINRDSSCDGVADGCIKVSVEVMWPKKGIGNNNIMAEEYLYNWR